MEMLVQYLGEREEDDQVEDYEVEAEELKTDELENGEVLENGELNDWVSTNVNTVKF